MSVQLTIDSSHLAFMYLCSSYNSTQNDILTLLIFFNLQQVTCTVVSYSSVSAAALRCFMTYKPNILGKFRGRLQAQRA